MNVRSCSSRSDSNAHCGDETSEKGASRASVTAARRKGVGDAIFVHGVVVLAPSARTPPTLHYCRALALDGECRRGSGIMESFLMRRDDALSCPYTSVDVSRISVRISVNGIASTSNTTSAFHFVTPSNRCVGLCGAKRRHQGAGNAFSGFS